MRENQRIVGRVLFLNADGGAQFTAHYALPHSLREAELSTPHGVYRQNHQREDGQYVYKYFRPLVGPADEYLTDYREPTDAAWDGPRGERPMATWKLLDDHLHELASREVTQRDLRWIRALSYAAFHHLPVPESPIEPTPILPVGIVPPALVEQV